MRVNEELSEQFKRMGVDIAPMVTDQSQEDFEVMPINWHSVCAFLDSQTQWRALARGLEVLWTGLDYPAVEVVLHRLVRSASDLPLVPKPNEDQVWRDIQHMERTALDVFNGVTS